MAVSILTQEHLLSSGNRSHDHSLSRWDCSGSLAMRTKWLRPAPILWFASALLIGVVVGAMVNSFAVTNSITINPSVQFGIALLSNNQAGCTSNPLICLTFGYSRSSPFRFQYS